MQNTADVRILSCTTLQSPEELKREYPITGRAAETVLEGRRAVESILDAAAGKAGDDRILAVVGPCSIHDPKAALEYASRLVSLQKRIADRILLVMRVYFEKPRTTVGWRGLILDPAMDGSGDINAGLKIARKLLVDITSQGLPVGSEMLDPIVPQYIADLVSWASIGARTTESQTHREMASGLSMPVGFKNGTDGGLETAINAMVSSMSPHSFIGIDQHGLTSVLKTSGNRCVHLILRGGKHGPNYHEESVERAVDMLKNARVPEAIMIDCSHANVARQYRRQARVFTSFLHQRREGMRSLFGAMLESNLVEGSQAISGNQAGLVYGQSVTDPCIGWDETERLLLEAHRSLKEFR
jgi:3-deoxy-7-phosphoheptulonate synthase